MNSLMKLSITAPSGTGKTTIAQKLVKEYRRDFINSISYTTRPPREDEIPGKDYYFIDKKKFQELVDHNELIEWASYMGNFYGTPISEIERCKSLKKRGIIFILENEGVKQLKEKYPDSISIFVIPTSIDSLAGRIKYRNEVDKRLENAKKEIQNAVNYDYIVENWLLDATLNTIDHIITAEFNRPVYMNDKVNVLLRS